VGTVVNLRAVPDTEQAAPSRAPAPRSLVRSPQIAELRIFCAAIDLGSIGRAARLLHVTQPALSKRLQALEAVAGTKLLNRSTRGVTPTPAGAHLYSSARRLLADADALDALLAGFSTEAAPVRVASSPTIAECWLPQALVDLERRHERHLSVEVITANSAVVRRLVRDGHSEMGLAALQPEGERDDGLNEAIIYEDEVIVAVPPGHRWAGVDEIDPEDFAQTPLIRRDPGADSCRVVQAALEQLGLTQVPPLAEIGSTGAARAAAVAEGVPVLLPRLALCDGSDIGMLVRRVAGVRFERQLALVLAGWLHDLTPSARALAQHLLAWQELGE
jgi:DNA-binding transcriptional LysR family regulator